VKIIFPLSIKELS